MARITTNTPSDQLAVGFEQHTIQTTILPISKYYINLSKVDLKERTDKLIINRIFEADTVLDSTIVDSGPIYELKLQQDVVGHQLIVNSGSGFHYNQILRTVSNRNEGFKGGTSDPWIPLSFSGGSVNGNKIHLITLNKDIIGDSLLDYHISRGRFTVIGSEMGTLYAHHRSKLSGIDWDNSELHSFVANQNLFILTDDENQTSISHNDVEGLIFGELGWIMVFNNDDDQNIMAKNFINKQIKSVKVYFCKIPHNRANFTTNPTWLIPDQQNPGTYIMRLDPQFTAISSVGLYNQNNELLAIAKLSRPLLKDEETELVIKVLIQW